MSTITFEEVYTNEYAEFTNLMKVVQNAPMAEFTKDDYTPTAEDMAEMAEYFANVDEVWVV